MFWEEWATGEGSLSLAGTTGVNFRRRFARGTAAWLLLWSVCGGAGAAWGGAERKPERRPVDLLDIISKDVRGTYYNKNRCIPSGTFVKNPRKLTPEMLRKIAAAAEKRAGVMQVKAGNVALCPICHKPLYLHDKKLYPNFKCVPVDRNGHIKRVQKIKYKPAICPVCGAEFPGPLRGNLNDKLGRDRDSCRHGVGKTVVYSSVWLCPRCGYAALTKYFNRKVDEKTKAFVREHLSLSTRKQILRLLGWKPVGGRELPKELAPLERFIAQTDIPDWLKYENAVRLYERLPLPHNFMASLYLDAAHSYRRALCAPVEVTTLDPVLQASVGRSARKVDAVLSALCFDYRRTRGEKLITPTYVERDPYVSAFVAYQLLTWDERGGIPMANKPNFRLTPGDLFVLWLRYAGFLDRCGYSAKAEQALARAEDVLQGVDSTAPRLGMAKQKVASRLAPLLEIVGERKRFLAAERKFLLRAAWRFMGALKSNEAPKRMAPLRFAYLIGELLRRCGEEETVASRAWFNAAARLLPRLDAKLSPEQRATDDLYRRWIAEQKSLLPPPADGAKVMPEVKEVITELLKRAGVSAAAANKTGVTVPPPAAGDSPKRGRRPKATPAPAPTKTAVNLAGDGRRRALLKACWEALQRWRTKKGTNAPKLQTLVAAGYLKGKDLKFDAAGDLVCPETGKSLLYARSAPLNDPRAAVIFPLNSDPCRLTLYGTGRVAVPSRAKTRR